MSKQVYIGMIPDEFVMCLLDAAHDAGLANHVFVCNERIKDEATGETLQDHLTVYSDKPELSKKLWERYDFHIAWKDSNTDKEIEGILNGTV